MVPSLLSGEKGEMYCRVRSKGPESVQWSNCALGVDEFVMGGGC